MEGAVETHIMLVVVAVGMAVLADVGEISLSAAQFQACMAWLVWRLSIHHMNVSCLGVEAAADIKTTTFLLMVPRVAALLFSVPTRLPAIHYVLYHKVATRHLGQETTVVAVVARAEAYRSRPAMQRRTSSPMYRVVLAACATADTVQVVVVVADVSCFTPRCYRTLHRSLHSCSQGARRELLHLTIQMVPNPAHLELCGLSVSVHLRMHSL
jgi:hypothetical protein